MATVVTPEQIVEWRQQVASRDLRIRERFPATEYICEASSDERFALWWRFHEHYRVPWEDDSRGYMDTIANLHISDDNLRNSGPPIGFDDDVLPIVVEVFWSKLGPSWVAFIGSPSLLVHHGLLEAWRNAVFPCATTARYQWHADAANFAHIIHDIEARHDVELMRQDVVDAILKRIDDPVPVFEDSQTAVEWCDRKVDEWAARRDFYNKKLHDEPAHFPANAPRNVRARCALCDPDGRVTRTDGVGGKWRDSCAQCNGSRFLQVQL